MPGESQSLINAKLRHCCQSKLNVVFQFAPELFSKWTGVCAEEEKHFLGRIFLIILVQSHPLCFKINPLCLCQTQNTFPIVILRFSQGNCKTPFPLFCQHIIFWPPRKIATLPFQNEKFFKQLS